MTRAVLLCCAALALAPAQKRDDTIQIAGLQVSVWRPPTSGRAPLVLFSHGFHGNSTQSTFLMHALAADGYLVLAPNHKDAMANAGSLRERPDARFRDPDSWTDSTYKDRGDDIAALMNALRASPEWERRIDWSQVALVGHSLGGYTVLGLAGAWPRWKLPEVKAVVALSPYAAPYISNRSLDRLGIPVMYQGGTRDIGVWPSLKKGNGAYELTSAPAYYVEFQGAGHLAWTDLTRQSHTSITEYTRAFLNRYVRGDRTANASKRLSDVSDLRVK